MIEGCVNEARMAQWEEMGELFIEEEDIEEPCTEEDEIEELYATNDPIGEEPPPKMRRTKSIAKKPAPKVPQVRGSGTLRFNSAAQRERYQTFMQKPIVPPYMINLDTLEEFGIREEVEALLGEKEWRYILVDFEEAIYPDLVLEVMTTLQVPKTIDLMSTKCISFTVGSTVFQFSPNDLSRYLEIDAMQGLSEEELEQRATDVPNMLEFWTELSGSNTRYDASSSKSSLFSKPLKLIQHTLSRSICGRQYSTGVAQTLDMLCLYGMVKKVNVHLGWVIAFLFQKQSYPKVKTLFVGPYLTRILRNAHNSIIPEIPYKQLQENKTEIDRDILLSLFKDMRAILGPVGNTRKRPRRGAAAQAQQRVEIEEENEEGQENEEDQEEEMQAMPEVGGGSSSSTFEQQVLAQLAAMQLQVGQVHSQVGLLNSRMDNLETAVERLETRNEAHAYQTWLRGQFPPGPQYYYDPAGGPPHFYSSAGSSQPYYGAAGGSQYYFDPAEGSQPQYDPSRGPQFPYDPTDF
nr:hypothetical protein GOBAR_AA35343 [Ipomoea batatas]